MLYMAFVAVANYTQPNFELGICGQIYADAYAAHPDGIALDWGGFRESGCVILTAAAVVRTGRCRGGII